MGLVLAVIALLGVATGIGFYVMVERVSDFSLVYCRTYVHATVVREQAWLWIIISSLAWGLVWYVFRCEAKKRGRTFAAGDLLRVFCPVLPLALLGLFPPGIWSAILLILGLALALLRGTAAWTTVSPRQWRGKPRWHCFILPAVAALTLAMAGVGFWYQKRALDTLYLLCTDWTDYLSVVDGTLHGNWFSANGGNFLGSHFSPGSILLLCPYVWLFHSKEAFFLLNSLLLYSNVLLLYWLARTLRLPHLYAGGLALCMLLSPSLMNMNVALFYGFHDIYMAMPLILLFFIFYEKRRWIPAFACFVLSLLIKETVPVFWAGLGLVFVLWGRRKTGIVLFVCSCVYWLLAMKLFIPAISSQQTYDYAYRFSHLGRSIWEIALSPVLKPLVFLTYLLRPGCLLFVVMLLLPVFFLVINRPLLLLGAGVTLVFICVQITTELQNIHMQYQAETVVLVFVCAAYNLRWILDGRPGWVFQQLCRWTGFRFEAATGARAILAASLVTAAGAFWFFGENPWGKVRSTDFTDRPNFSATVAHLKTLIPPAVPIQATLNLGGHFMLRNPVSADLKQVSAAYVLLDLNCGFHDIRQMDLLRQKLFAAGYRVVFAEARGLVNVVLFSGEATAAAAAAAANVAAMADAEWSGFGEPVVDDVPPELQLRFAETAQPRPALRFRARLTRNVNRDYSFVVTRHTGDGQTFRDKFAFGNGVLPAFLAQPGHVYTFETPIPGKQFFAVTVEPRPNLE